MEGKQCVGCGIHFSNKVKSVRYCSVICARRNAPRKRNGPEPKERRERECPTCQKSFAVRWDRQVCCSKSCARAYDSKRYGNGNFKGGRWKINTGYVKVLAKDHPRRDVGGYVLEHIIVMEKKLGRYLHEFERVHHKNGKRDDNRIANLELWVGNNGRSKKDPSGQRMADLLAEFLSQPEIADRAAVEAAFRRVFRV